MPATHSYIVAAIADFDERASWIQHAEMGALKSLPSHLPPKTDISFSC